MVVTVYARHSARCPQSKVRHAGQYRRCKCPLWLRWGRSHKRSARTRSWEIATKAARKLEEELEHEALGLEPPKKPDHIVIEAAVDLYLEDMAQRGVKDPSKVKRLLGRLRDYAYARDVFLLKDVSARLLTEWRARWSFNKQSGGPAVHWSIVKTFFRWAFSIDLIPADVSAKLKSLPCVRQQVQPLTRDEMGRLLAATSQCGFAPEIAARVKTFILLQRWSGLAEGVVGSLHEEARGSNQIRRKESNRVGAGEKRTDQRPSAFNFVAILLFENGLSRFLCRLFGSVAGCILDLLDIENILFFGRSQFVLD